MSENFDIIKPVAGEINKKKNSRQLSENCTSYRGFTSIDQEMERDIAMQWFEKTSKIPSFRGTFLYKGKLS